MAITKAQRFGYFERNNMDDILSEINDVSECIEIMKSHLDQIKREVHNPLLDTKEELAEYKKKLSKIKRLHTYLHKQLNLT